VVSKVRLHAERLEDDVMEEMEVDDGGVEGQVVRGDEVIKTPPVRTRRKIYFAARLMRDAGVSASAVSNLQSILTNIGACHL
jgi:hypothetical protein